MAKTFRSTHAKYLTSNPISRYLVSSFFLEVERMASSIEYKSVLDVGCGEAHLLSLLSKKNPDRQYYAIDNDEKELAKAKENLPFCEFIVGSIHKIPFPDNFADFVINTEVLEHVEHPETAIEELHRVSSHYLMISVPREPLWRILNILRFHYWNDLGNTPGHVNHWSRRSFVTLLSRWFSILQIKNPYPWTLVLCEKSKYCE